MIIRMHLVEWRGDPSHLQSFQDSQVSLNVCVCNIICVMINAIFISDNIIIFHVHYITIFNIIDLS